MKIERKIKPTNEKKNKEIKTVSIAKQYCVARIPFLKEFLTMYFNQGCI